MSTKSRRVLVAKPGLDGHDRGAKTVVYALRDAGFEVIYTGLHNTPEQIVKTALEEGVDVVGLSIMSGAHVSIAREVLRLLREAYIGDTPPALMVGGVIPERDVPVLLEMGAGGVFPVGSPFEDIVRFVMDPSSGSGGPSDARPASPPSASPMPPAPPRTPQALRCKPGESFGSEGPSDARPASPPSASPMPPAPPRTPRASRPKPGSPEPRPVTLESGIEVKVCYGPEDVADLDYARDLGNPGEYPFTRGIHSTMYRSRPFTMRQYAGFGSPYETNKRFKYLIEHGQNALNVAFDLPTQNGLDSDDPRAMGEVGRVGMAVDTLADMETAFEGIDLSQISVSLTINPIASIMIAMYEAVAEKQGVPPKRIMGTAQNDILKEYIGRGTWIYDVEPSLRLTTDTVEYCTRRLPRYFPLSVCGYHIRESGADPVQEMAWAFLIAKEYARRAMSRGLSPDEFLGRFSFNLNIHGNFFEQVAKFRAGRRLWAEICKEELGAKEPRSMMLRGIFGGGGGGLTIQEPENNIVRMAYYALASALSGTQTMALCCYDEAYTIPSERASLISLRTMQLLQEEVGVCDTVDPLAGSYYVEALTGEMQRRIQGEMARIDGLGGIVRCVADGYIQKTVARQAYEEERRIRSGEKVKVGVNKYATEKQASHEVELHEFDEAAQKEQIARLDEARKSRDGAAAKACLERLRDRAANTSENLMPYILECVRAYCTVGEMSLVLKEVFGEFKEPIDL